MEASPAKFQVVRKDQEESNRDEEGEPGPKGERAHNADRAGACDRDTGERGKDSVRNLRPQWSPVQLVEGVATDSDREGKRGDGGAEPFPRDDGREAATDDDVREMPCRVWRMEQRHVVPPAAARECVPGRTGDRLHRSGHDAVGRTLVAAHVFCPHMTTAAPKLSRLASTWLSPAACHHSSCRSSGWRCQKSRIDPPRKEPTSLQPRPKRRPASGSAAST